MKLIILNGSVGTGKSTIGKRIHEEMPMSVLIEGDEWRRQISHWHEHRKESHDLVYAMKIAAADVTLKAGYSVVIDKAILGGDEIIDALIARGKAHSAEVYELILNARKEVVSARVHERESRPNSTLTSERVMELWGYAQELIVRRTNAVVIDTSDLSIDEVYAKVKGIVFG